MPNQKPRRIWRTVLVIVLSLLLIIVGLPFVATALFSQRLTGYIESEKFRVDLEQQTAKGLHFTTGHYEPIKRTGMWTAESAGFHGEGGRKAMRTMNVQRVTAKFNPWGVLLRRWQLDDLRVDSGEVSIQTYEPKPEPTPAKPWFHFILPQRVYLKQVESAPVDVTWQFRGATAGFFGTRLLITPHGRDFNYQATGGMMRSAPMPELRLRQTRMQITKKWITLYNLDLQPRDSDTGSIHAEGEAGLGEDKSVDMRMDIMKMPIDDWLPNGWRQHVVGMASGKIAWRGKDTKLESSHVEASLTLEDGRVSNLPFLEKLAALTNEKEIERFTLNECVLDLVCDYPNCDVKISRSKTRGSFAPKE